MCLHLRMLHIVLQLAFYCTLCEGYVSMQITWLSLTGMVTVGGLRPQGAPIHEG